MDFEEFYKKYDDSLKRIQSKQQVADFETHHQIPNQSQFVPIKSPQFTSNNLAPPRRTDPSNEYYLSKTYHTNQSQPTFQHKVKQNNQTQPFGTPIPYDLIVATENEDDYIGTGNHTPVDLGHTGIETI